MLPVVNPRHYHVRCVLNVVVGLGGGPVANGQANNRHETESTTTTTPCTSTATLRTPSLGWCATVNPSPSTAKGHGQRAIASRSTSVVRGRGRRVTTPRVVTSPEIPAPISHASPQLEVPPPILDASPQSEVLPPMVDASLQPKVLSPTSPSHPSFDLGINFHLTSPMHPETPSYLPTSSSATTLPIDPPRTKPMTMIPTLGLYTKHHYPPTYLILIRPSTTFNWDWHSTARYWCTGRASPSSALTPTR